jgi:hypothetical protein
LENLGGGSGPGCRARNDLERPGNQHKEALTGLATEFSTQARQRSLRVIRPPSRVGIPCGSMPYKDDLHDGEGKRHGVDISGG